MDDGTKTRLGARSDAEAFVPDLMHGGRFVAGKISGGPVPGVDDMNRGILPEPYWAAAGEAVYAVYQHETPIVWKLEDGTWQAPDHRYGTTTSQVRSKILAALSSQGIEAEKI